MTRRAFATRFILGAALLFGGWLTGCHTASPTPPANTPPPLLLISIDGFRADYLERHAPPTLTTLAREGMRAEALIPVFPSLTFPNHYTIVTGLYPDHHGIIANTLFDSTLGWFRLSDRDAVSDGRWWQDGEPIWVTAARQGLRTATYFWPGSEAEIHGVRPTYWIPYDSSIPGETRVRQVLEWLALPDSLRPRFLTLYFSDVDHAGHEYGPDAPAVAEAVQQVDGYLRLLVDGLKAQGWLGRMHLLIVSDHGMTATSYDRVIFLDDYISLKDVQVVNWSPVLMLTPRSSRFEAVLQALQQAHPHLHVYRKESLPTHLHFGTHRRIPPIIGLADAGWTITARERFMQSSDRFPAGMHGYDPTLPAMHGILIAHGPAFVQGQVVPPVENIHLYALMCHLLGITPAPNYGSLEATASMLSFEKVKP